MIQIASIVEGDGEVAALPVLLRRLNEWRPRCEDSIGCMHGSSEPDLRNWKSPPPQFTQGARPDEHP
ncbi:hypothetical protein EHO76_15580 [Bordetella pertussis]|nr:hypothetical protein EHO76_15580 [Bordetella pertussis]AZX44554.1 hypothetical protein CXD91_16255 [Bordetella pertussis]